MHSVVPASNVRGWTWAAVALAIALAGTAGSLYLSVGMGLKACPLCFYQRSFMMAALAVLAVGLAADRSQAHLLSLAAFPLAVAGMGVAGFHEYLVLGGTLECPPGLFGLGVAPLQSLIVFAVLVVASGLGAGRRIGLLAAGTIFGLALAWGCVASSPPLPPAPAKPYDGPLETCRPPYRPS
jgi:disulfide bond formation protein DsbB